MGAVIIFFHWCITNRWGLWNNNYMDEIEEVEKYIQQLPIVISQQIPTSEQHQPKPTISDAERKSLDSDKLLNQKARPLPAPKHQPIKEDLPPTDIPTPPQPITYTKKD